MGAVTTPVFYIFGIVAIASAIIVCGFTPLTVLVALFLVLLAAAGAALFRGHQCRGLLLE